MGKGQQLEALLDKCLSRHFGIKDKDFRTFLKENAQYIDLTSGDTLIHQGETCDAVYFLLTGNLRALFVAADGKTTPLGEIGRGETVGELALFTGKKRGANVVAIRDSIVAKVSGQVMEEAIGKQPKIALKITRQIIERYERMQAMTAPPKIPVSITFIPITPNVDIKGFIDRLMKIRQENGEDVLLVNHDYIKSHYGELNTPDVFQPRGDVSLALSELELKHSNLFYVARPPDKAWCHTAIHHSDEVVLIANPDETHTLSNIESELLRGHENLRAPVTLVLMHDNDRKSPTQTAKWLAERKSTRHFHIRKSSASDFSRLNRILSGQARGIVLAGGGARGMAHLGVMTALGEYGVEFDFIGGTSAGAIMGSFAAMGVKAEDLREATRDIFMNSPFGKISGDYNLLPLYSVIKGNRAYKVSHKAVMDSAGSDIDMEDCWKTFFAIASNFTTHEEQALSYGNLARNVLASFSIPGLMPPSIMNGDLLFDGGSFNNFPVDHIRKLGAKYIVGVDLLSDRVHKHEISTLPKIQNLVWDKLRPKKKQKYKRLPTLANTLLTASVVTSMARQKQFRPHVDILLQPNTQGVGLLDWHKYDVIYERARTDTLSQLETMDDNILKHFQN